LVVLVGGTGTGKTHLAMPDYAFGHTLQERFEASLKKFGGTEVGASPGPLGRIHAPLAVSAGRA
jgi:hypothetical protein